MKKWIPVIVIILAICIVFIAGFIKRKHMNVTQTEIQKEEADNSSLSQYDEEVQNEIVDEDIKTLSENNVVELDEDGQISVYMGGLTYTITRVLFFDSPEAFYASDVFKEEYLLSDLDHPNTEIVYIEYDITNEKSIKWEYLPANLMVYYINQRGYNYDDTAYGEGEGPTPETGAVKGNGGEICYATIPEKPVDEKNTIAPVLEPGETLSLTAAFSNWNSVWNNGSKVSEFYEGNWYLSIPGSMNLSNEFFNIYENKSQMFIKLN